VKLISDKYSLSDMERFLDRIAQAIAARDEPGDIILLYEWLEAQIEARQKRDATIDRARNRAAQLVKK
jgi:hypothetical protein